MFRLLGFLVGSVASAVAILLIVGMPTFNDEEAKEARERYDAAIEKLRARQQEIESVTGKLTEDVARVSENLATPGIASPVSDGVTIDVIELPETVAAKVVGEVAVETSWYSFWNPFRSEIAANGFVSRLESVTGIDYRVVKVKAGVYEVAFPYSDDAERLSKLDLIARATGLDLPES